MKYLLRICLSAVALTAIFTVQTSAAAKPAGLSMSPLRIYPSQNPGITGSYSFKLSNQTGGQMPVELSVEKFKTINEDYDYAFEPVGKDNWVSLSAQQIDLNPHETKSVDYQIAIPIDIKPGGYYFMIVATTKDKSSGSSFVQVKRLSSLIYLQVAGQITHKLNMDSISASWLTMAGNVQITALISNGGNSHDEGVITVKANRWPFGKTKNHVIQGLILPATVRKLNDKINLGYIPGIYKLSAEFDQPQGGITVKRFSIIYFPIWLLSLLILGFAYLLRQRKS